MYEEQKPYPTTWNSGTDSIWECEQQALFYDFWSLSKHNEDSRLFLKYLRKSANILDTLLHVNLKLYPGLYTNAGRIYNQLIELSETKDQKVLYAKKLNDLKQMGKKYF